MTTPKLTKSHIRAIILLPTDGSYNRVLPGHAPCVRALAKVHPPAGIAVKAALEASP